MIDKSSNDLPDSWDLKTFASIAGKPQYGWTTRAKSDASIKLLRTTDITSGSVNWTIVPGCEEPPPNIDKYRLQPGDIVVSRAGSVGFSYLVDESCPPDSVFASYLMRIHPDPAVMRPDLLHHFMLSPQYWRQVREAAVGVGLANVNGSKLSAMRVPVPPRALQDELAQMLESAQSRTVSASRHLSASSRAIERFRQAVLTAGYSGHLTTHWRETGNVEQSSSSKYLQWIGDLRRKAWSERKVGRKYVTPDTIAPAELPEIPASWEWATADSVCSQITDGEHIQAPYQSTGYPMLSAKHVRDGFVDPTGAGLISNEAFRKAIERCAPVNGDILIVSVGATTGRSAIVENCEPFAIVRSVLLLKPLISARFLLRWLQTPWCFQWMTQASGASAQPHLYIRDVKRLPVPIPPLGEEEEIIRQLDQLLKFEDSLGKRIDSARRQIERSSHAILAKAFRGELLPTGATPEASAAQPPGDLS